MDLPQVTPSSSSIKALRTKVLITWEDNRVTSSHVPKVWGAWLPHYSSIGPLYRNAALSSGTSSTEVPFHFSPPSTFPEIEEMQVLVRCYFNKG